MIPATTLPILVAIAIISRRHPFTALGTSLVWANYNFILTGIGVILIIHGQIKYYREWKEKRFILGVFREAMKKKIDEIEKEESQKS